MARHTDIPWVRLYIARWLRAPVQRPDGTLEQRTKGTPQGGVISPLLANLFLHYAFDCWMQRTFPGVHFERYADDAIVHCGSERHARSVLEAIRGRFAQCGLALHPTKTRIVYCKDADRRGDHEVTTFTFLGYEFRPRLAKSRHGKHFVSFLPAVSADAMKAMGREIRSWHWARRSDKSLGDLALMFNSVVQGWINYYGPPLALPNVSFSDALDREEVPDGFFQGKVVLVGTRPTAGRFDERRDEWRSPLSGWGRGVLFMPAVEVQATELLNLMRGQGPEGKHVLLCREPYRRWALGRLPARRGEPVEVVPGVEYRDLIEAERDVFRRRWRDLTGRDLDRMLEQ